LGFGKIKKHSEEFFFLNLKIMASATTVFSISSQTTYLELVVTSTMARMASQFAQKIGLHFKIG
jgi:hypothetical protein